MALSGSVHTSGQYGSLMPDTDITAAGTYTTTPELQLSGMKYLVAEAKLTYGSGGTSVKAYVQTSLDQGETWIDIMSFAFTTASASKVSAVSAAIALAAAVAPTDGSLTDNTILNGLLGDRLRVKYVVTGTYAGTTLDIDMIAKG